MLQLQGQTGEAEPILRRAVDLNTTIAAKSPDDVQIRLDLAKDHNNLGEVLRNRGADDQAIPSYLKARSINEALVKAFSDKPRYREALAGNLVNLGLAQQVIEPAKVQLTFETARAIYEKLVAEFPENFQYRIGQARCLQNTGAVLAGAGRPEQAAACYRDALALLQTKHPGAQMPESLRSQAELYSNLGELGRDGAEDDLRHSIALSERLVAAAATGGEDRHNLAIAENNLGERMLNLKRLPEAGPPFARSVAHFEAIVEQAPKVVAYQSHFGIVLSGQAKVLDQTGKTAEAKAALVAAVEHQRQGVKLSNNAAPYRIALAEHLIALADMNRKLGAYDEAARLALEVPRTVPTSSRAQACFDAARVLARLVAQVGGDLKVPQAERDHMARVYLTRTVVLLRDAIDANPKLSEPIKADRDLKILESRPEFQTILNSLVGMAG